MRRRGGARRRHRGRRHGARGPILSAGLDATVPELVLAAARERPDHAPLRCGGVSLTYRELDDRSAHVAGELAGLGVGPDAPVAVCAGRSPATVAALLGVMRAGGAYVPIDPEAPAERQAQLIRDCGAGVLLTEAALRSRLPAFAGACVLLDAGRPGGRAAAAPVGPRPENLAYVMYTSGSTGRPKGVGVPHRALVSLLHAIRAATGVGPDDVVLAATALTFDISGLELWLPLVLGGRMILATDAERLDTAWLAGRLTNDVTVGQFTPTVWRLVLEAGWAGSPRLRALVGGEALPAGLASALHPRVRALHNVYGPTETTIWSTAHTFAAPPEAAVPIGRALANTTVHVLDPELRPVPEGSPGEICIGGDGVARGYVGRPDSTAERFVPDPFGGGCGARLYRTGDLGVRLPGGGLGFRGRLDDQLKIRGHRVEPGEVASVLAAHDGVAQAVAVGRPGAAPGAEPGLVAYVVPAAGGCDPEALRAWLAARLPEPMLPSAIVALERFPLTPNGKLDRRALPEPPGPRAPAPAAGGAAATDTEAAILRVFEEVLERQDVGRSGDFFSAGGHSLLAIVAAHRLRRRLGVALSVRHVFEQPTAAGLARVVERLAGGGPAADRELGAGGGEGAPSFGQQRLWFLDQLEPGSPLYNTPLALRLRGPLDVEALARSLREIVSRHESLRTRFEAVDGQPVRVVADEATLELPLDELAEPDPEARERLAAQRAVAEAALAFDLGRAPLLRARLVRLAADDHLLVLTLHHAVSDGWSVEVLIRELGVLYRAFSDGAASPLPPLPVQYSDFVAWQREQLAGGGLDEQVAYWTRQLRGAPPLLALPADRPRPRVQTFRGAHHQFQLSAGLVDRLRRLSRERSATLYMTLLAAYDVLLSRYTERTDVVVGSTIANRPLPELDGLVGFFANTLVLRTDLSGDPAFVDLLDRVRQVTLDAYGHPDLPFEQLVELLQPERVRSHGPLCQVTFAYQNVPAAPPALAGLDVTRTVLDVGTSRFDLTLTLVESDARVHAIVAYRTDLFDAWRIERLGRHYVRLLESIAADPSRPISTLPLLDSGERARAIPAPPSGAGAGTARPPVPRLFHEQVARTPGATAVVSGSRRLTYRELEERADLLSHRLREAGLTREARVGIAMEPSAEAVAAVLGVLGAGAAFVPIDPAWPGERAAAVLRDAGAAAVVTGPGAPPAFAVPTFRVPESPNGRVPAAGPAALPGQLAYLIPTSGSTGSPRAVAVEHGALTAYVTAVASRLGMAPGHRYAHLQPLSVDASLTFLLPPLVTGGCVHLVRRDVALDPHALADYLDAHAIDFLKLAPSQLRTLQETAAGRPPLPRSCLVLGGEPVASGWLDELRGAHPGLRVVSQYGPTETTVGVLLHEAQGEGGDPPAGAPLGRALGAARAYVLDRWLDPVPAGVPGMLYVGGPTLARGYAGRPAATAAAFVPDPHGPEPGARLYRTGDRASCLPGGLLLSHGREDRQVKVRGHRVEPAEIEHVLWRHPQVAEVAVGFADDPSGGALTAFVVPAAGAAIAPEELRSWTGARLPAHMVPARWVGLAELPRSGHGKVDLAALSRLAGAAPERAARTAPRSPAETALLRIWSEVLGRDDFGIEDSFFELGGHSLLATRVMARVNEAFAVEVPLREFFDGPTIVELATAVERAGAAGGEAVPRLGRRPRRPAAQA